MIVGPVIAGTMKLVKRNSYKKHNATWCASPGEHTPLTHHTFDNRCAGHEWVSHPVLAEHTVVETKHCQCCPISGGWSSMITCRARGPGLQGLRRHSNLLHPSVHLLYHYSLKACALDRSAHAARTKPLQRA